MKKKNPYKEINDANYIIDMMREDVFGHRVTMVTAKDTNKLKNKLYQPTTDAEKEDFVAIVEPIMNRKILYFKAERSKLRFVYRYRYENKSV